MTATVNCPARGVNRTPRLKPSGVGFLTGAVGYHNALGDHKNMNRLICYPDGTTREDGIREFIVWAQAHQDDSKLMNEAPVIGLMRSLIARWPCKGGQ